MQYQAQPPQKQYQAQPQHRQHRPTLEQPPQNQYQAPPSQMLYLPAPPPQMQYQPAPAQAQPPLQRPRQNFPAPAAPTAHRAPAGTLPPVNTSSKPRFHPRAAAKPASAFKKPTVACDVCDVRCMTAFHLKQHEKGRKHQNKVGYAAGEMDVRCGVCDVPLLTKLNVKQHYAGKKHLLRASRSTANGAKGKRAT
jgi:hypothetical protein